MTTPEQKDRWSRMGAIAILAAVAISIAFILSSCAANQAALPYHQGLQKEATFDNRLENVEAFTTKSAKQDNGALKKAVKAQEKQNDENAKRKAIEEENAELRAKLEAAKKNNPE